MAKRQIFEYPGEILWYSDGNRQADEGPECGSNLYGDRGLSRLAGQLHDDQWCVYLYGE